jgi:hypothetical protein
MLTYEDAGLRCRLGDGQEFKNPSSAGSAVMGRKPATASASGAAPRLRPRRGLRLIRTAPLQRALKGKTLSLAGLEFSKCARRG